MRNEAWGMERHENIKLENEPMQESDKEKEREKVKDKQGERERGRERGRERERIKRKRAREKRGRGEKERRTSSKGRQILRICLSSNPASNSVGGPDLRVRIQ